MPDYFEIDRLIEDLAKIYSTACATTWFKITKNKQPSKDEFRKKVAEFMKHFEYTLSTYPKTTESDQFRQYALNNLKTEIENVLAGNNKEVERRYKYYVDYS
jgi:predicted ATP-dependent endonuclease of OLD family